MLLNSYSSMKKNQKIFDDFCHRKLTLKVKILPFLTTFTQQTARLKHFLMSWLLFLGVKEGLIERATGCVKSEVILACTAAEKIHENQDHNGQTTNPTAAQTTPTSSTN